MGDMDREIAELVEPEPVFSRAGEDRSDGGCWIRYVCAMSGEPKRTPSPKYTSSIDASMRVIEKRWPLHEVQLMSETPGTRRYATLFTGTEDDPAMFSADSHAHALALALLSALRAAAGAKDGV